MVAKNWASLVVNELIALSSAATLDNFYLNSSDTKTSYSTSAVERLANLQAHLSAAVGGDLILVGEAAGWRGARQSGVAFTDAPHLGLVGTREASARTVHDALAINGLASRVLLWNALPLHPHDAGKPRSNRTPSNAELARGARVLEVAIRDRAIVCVGQKAAHAVSTLLGIAAPPIAAAEPGARAVTIRHPSHGGGPQFREDLRHIVTQGLLTPPAASRQR